MIAITCDACKTTVSPDDVVYMLAAHDPARVDLGAVLSRAHLHWRCVPGYGRAEHAVLTWDWREQPDLSDLHRALNGLAGLHVEQVDTGSDQYAIVISTKDVSRDEVDQIYRAHIAGDAA